MEIDGVEELDLGLEDAESSAVTPPAAVDQSVLELRKAQGQARRAEQEARNATARMAGLESRLDALIQLQNQPRQDPMSHLGEDVDPIVKAELTHLRQQVSSLSSQRQAEAATAQERQYRDNALNELQEYADVAGLDFSTIEKELKSTPTQDFWATGKRLIKEAKSGNSGNGTDRETRIRAEERAKTLKEHGIFVERRPSAGKPPQTFSEAEEAYGRGDISTEDYAALRRKHGR